MKLKTTIALVLFLGVLIFLSINRHNNADIQSYNSELWADKAGYFVYLPAAFIYNFDATQMPDSIDAKTGNGFNFKGEKIKTNYTYGVALMQSPFFLGTHFYLKATGGEATGFSMPYYKMINVAAVVYTVLSLILLYLILLQFTSKRTSLLTIGLTYLGTNLFYYSIFETGMSHIYSFFLFNAFIYLALALKNNRRITLNFVLLGLVTGGIIAVRPINALFLPTFFIFCPWSVLKNYWKQTLSAAILACLVVVPQLIYWNYLTGKPIIFSYDEHESFANLFSPKLLEIWFAPYNGLFVYSPLFIFFLLGLYFLFKKDRLRAVWMGAYFLFISYIFASWYDWTYGCSLGARPFVEYYSLFTIPFALLIENIQKKRLINYVLWAIILVFVGYTQKIMFTYDGCWTYDVWNWNELWQLIISPTK